MNREHIIGIIFIIFITAAACGSLYIEIDTEDLKGKIKAVCFELYLSILNIIDSVRGETK